MAVRHVEAFTASATLNHRYNGALCTNRGAGGSVTLTLPGGGKGLTIDFQRVAAQTFTVARAGADTILDPDGASQTSITVTGALNLTHDGTAWVQSAVSAASLAADSISATQLADGCIDDSAKLVAGVVATTDLAASAVTGPKLIGTGWSAGHFVGRNGAGACTLTGAVVGDRVLVGWLSSEAATDTTVGGENTAVTRAAFVALFETAITVTDQIQQTSASDLSGNKYSVIMIPASA